MTEREWEPTQDEVDAAASVLVRLADTDKAATWRDGARLALLAARRQAEAQSAHDHAHGEEDAG